METPLEPVLARRFIVIPSFYVKWTKIGFTEDDMVRLESMLLRNPKVGAVIQGTHGARKLRFAFLHRGKSGSARVIYVDFEVAETIFLLDVYAKSDQENLSKADRNKLGDFVEELELSLEEEHGKV